MQVSTPKDMERIPTLERAISLFEDRLKKELKGLPYYRLVISEAFSEKMCEEVKRLYLEAGWGRVKCECTSLKSELYGLTTLELYVSTE